MQAGGDSGSSGGKTVLIIVGVLVGIGLLCCGGGFAIWKLKMEPAIEDLQAQFIGVEGSGVALTETRDVASFKRIRLEGSTDVQVVVGAATQSLTITLDDNLMELLQTEVVNGTLVISEKEKFRSKLVELMGAGLIEIEVPALDGLEIVGMGDATVIGIAGALFELDVQGMSDVMLAGKTEDLFITVDGMGDVDASELVSSRAKVSLSGSGDIDVHATESLDATVEGMGDVTYSGDPGDVKTDVDGMGSVEPR